MKISVLTMPDRRSGNNDADHWFQRRVCLTLKARYDACLTSLHRSVQYANLNFDVWDLGGQTSIRPYWRSYYANTAAVIFVIDSTDIERLETAADELRSMLNEEELKDAALLVFANKQDQVCHATSSPERRLTSIARSPRCRRDFRSAEVG